MAAPEAPGVGPPAQDESIIREGSRIILDVNGDRHVFVVVKGRKYVVMEEEGDGGGAHAVGMHDHFISVDGAGPCSGLCLQQLPWPGVLPSQATSLVHLPCSKVKLGQAFCSIQPLIGCPYGSTFGVAPDGKTLQQIPPCVLGLDCVAHGVGRGAVLLAGGLGWAVHLCCGPPYLQEPLSWPASGPLYPPFLFACTAPSRLTGWRRRRWR